MIIYSQCVQVINSLHAQYNRSLRLYFYAYYLWSDKMLVNYLPVYVWQLNVFDNILKLTMNVSERACLCLSPITAANTAIISLSWLINDPFSPLILIGPASRHICSISFIFLFLSSSSCKRIQRQSDKSLTGTAIKPRNVIYKCGTVPAKWTLNTCLCKWNVWWCSLWGTLCYCSGYKSQLQYFLHSSF